MDESTSKLQAPNSRFSPGIMPQEHRVYRLAAGPAGERLAAALGALGKVAGTAPAGAEITELGGGEKVLGLNALRPGLVSQGLQPATGQINLSVGAVRTARGCTHSRSRT